MMKTNIRITEDSTWVNKDGNWFKVESIACGQVRYNQNGCVQVNGGAKSCSVDVFKRTLKVHEFWRLKK